ncbi:MAG: hypothetical protein KC609_15065, partial [Myxococcales bacterium]|nr:hypothetical protein [Myxococcales bacterium]
LRELSESANVHPLIAARALRYRIDARQLPSDEVQRRLGRALCAAQPATIAAAWFEGFFSGSGLLLVHDRSLFEILDRWLVSLGDDDFIALLPLLRRTAASFDPAERRQIFARASREGPNRAEGSPTMFDRERALCVLPLLLAIDEASRARDEARESATDDEELG